MKLHPFTSLRLRLVMLVLLAVLPALALILYTAAEQSSSERREALADARRVAELASLSQEQLIESASQLLVAIAQISEVRGTDPDAASAALKRHLEIYSSLYFNFGVINRDGSVFASAVPLESEVNLKDRAYFRRAVESKQLALGEFQIGRITNRPSINVGYPLVDPGTKEVERVIFAAVDLEWLEKVASKAALPVGATLTVVDSRGVILAGWPEPERWRGEPVGDEETLRLISGGEPGIAEIRATDGTRLLVAFAPLRAAQGPTHVAVRTSIPREVALADSTAALRRNLFWFAIVTLLALAAAWFGGDSFILQQVRAILAATRRVRAGDLTARTGVRGENGELGQLAHAFDEMAASLQDRNAARERAELQLKISNELLEQRVLDRTLELRRKSEQLEADLELAREFQAGLLPHHVPLLLPGTEKAHYTLRLSHRYEPSGAVGGDFFEILPLSTTEAGIFVCDVMGHGVRAALLAAIIRGLTEQLKPVAHDPGLFMSEVNDALFEILRGTGATMFATAAYVVVDIGRKTLRYTSAGHSKPLHLRRGAGQVSPLQLTGTATGPVLGLFHGTKYVTGESSVEAGDGLLIYTDGVFEVSSPQHEEFGEQRLRDAIQRRVQLPLEKIFTEVIGEIHEFSASGFNDDVCIVGVEITLKAVSEAS